MSKSCYKDHNWAWQHMTCYPVLGKLRCMQGQYGLCQDFCLKKQNKNNNNKTKTKKKNPKTKKPLQVCANQICSSTQRIVRHCVCNSLLAWQSTPGYVPVSGLLFRTCHLILANNQLQVSPVISLDFSINYVSNSQEFCSEFLSIML